MNDLLIIVCIIVGAGVLAFVGMSLYLLISIAKGKMTTKQLDDMVAKNKAKKRKTKSSGSAHWLSYPSPLNNWGLWN